MTLEEARRILRKTAALEHAQIFGNVAQACREFQVPRSSFYRWRRAYETEGQAGLIRKRPIGRRCRKPSAMGDDVKTIGLIGGMSWTSTELYYRELNALAQRRLGKRRSLPMLLWSVDFEEHLQIHERLGWEGVAREVVEIGLRLKEAGAELLAMCANTLHRVAGEVESDTGLPLVSVIDAVGKAIRAAGVRRVGLLGTRRTMAGSFYRQRLQTRYGIETLIPEHRDMAAIDAIIFERLSVDVYDNAAHEECKRIMRRLIEEGAEGIILGCTELPRLVCGEPVEYPLFDSLRLHVHAIVDAALSSETGR